MSADIWSGGAAPMKGANVKKSLDVEFGMSKEDAKLLDDVENGKSNNIANKFRDVMKKRGYASR